MIGTDSFDDPCFDKSIIELYTYGLIMSQILYN
jgi:hypothetical protein